MTPTNHEAAPTRAASHMNGAVMAGLNIFPKHPTADDTYYIGGAWAPACITAKDKRFTDAELAAEHWAQAAIYFSALANDDEFDFEPFKTIYRFATLPHYDEERA